ncbi:protein NUCLEAR FUSION DEFECTIVE 6, mitochondrial-like isoform X2 [Curcuma longa]|uniref:protein NUCLEAR FUSION DEFECTIVE 6, mitochondrial-like isoform X2 n=1 Tax=Curcuma longa TaxID=136217 RepID=UPI003D9EA08F
MASAAARSVLRSASLRGRTPRVGVTPAAPSRPPVRRLPNQRPAVAERYRRSPLAASFCVESLMPLHSATAAALMTSMLGVSHRNYWGLSEAGRGDA